MLQAIRNGQICPKGILLFYDLSCSVSICSGGSIVKLSKCQCPECPGFVSLHILPQGLADELRLNRIITWLCLIEQNICDEQLKAPPELGEGDGFSWGPRCLPVAGDLGR